MCLREYFIIIIFYYILERAETTQADDKTEKHQGGVDDGSRSKTLQQNGLPYSAKRRIACHVCGKRFRKVIGLTSHAGLHAQKSKESKETPLPGLIVSNPTNTQSYSGLNSESELEVSAADVLQKRTEPSSKNCTYKCKVGLWEFGQLRGLMRVHCGRKQLVDDELKYFCEKCDFVAVNSLSLARHVFQTHGQRYFSSDLQCVLFGRDYSASDDVSREYSSNDDVSSLPHMPSRSVPVRLHDMMDVGVNGNACRLCGRRLRSVFSLKRHVLELHHGITWPRRMKDLNQPVRIDRL